MFGEVPDESVVGEQVVLGWVQVHHEGDHNGAVMQGITVESAVHSILEHGGVNVQTLDDDGFAVREGLLDVWL